MAFFAELKRRNVVRVGIAYVVVAWLLAQVADLALGAFGAPDWVLRSFLILLGLGLPLALFFSWVFEVTPEGIRREKEVDRSVSITRQTGRKLDRAIIVILGVAVAMLLTKEFYFDRTGDAATEVVTTAGRQSIAVLPFVNMSGDDDYFADGLTEELMNVLAKNRDLKVAGRTSSFAFKGQTPNFREIGDTLRVENVLEGSVRRSGDRIRVTAQLIKVEDGFHVWSETYDRDMADIFDIQDDVAGAISRELDLRLTPVADRPTADLDAYELYLQARADMNSLFFLGPDVIERIDQALQIDPEFAKAAELKAVVYWLMAGLSLDAPTARGLIYESAVAALRLDPDLVIAGALADMTLPDELSWVPEFDAVERAVTELPNDYMLLRLYRYELSMAGYFSEALEIARRVVDIEPLGAIPYHGLAIALMSAGNEEEAYAAWRRAAELGGDDYLMNVAMGHVIAGEFGAAVEPLEKAWAAMGLDPDDAKPFIEGASDPVNGKPFLDNWIRRSVSEAQDYRGTILPYSWYLAFGYFDDYYAVIDRFYGETYTTWTNAETLEVTGMAFPGSGYRSHPGFIPHMQRISMTEIWDRRGAPDRCSKESGVWVCE